MPASTPLRGVIVPLATPFDRDGEIDEAAFRREVGFMIEKGVDGVVVGGSTGEGYALTDSEFLALVAAAIEAAAGRVPVVASVIADSTRAAVARATAAAALPIAALQVAPPHYIFAPDAAGQVAFYGAVAAAVPLPIIVYNVIPWDNVTAETAVAIMRATPSVIAVKQSDRDFGAYAALVEAVGADRVFAAIDGGLMSCYELGAAGSIAAIATAAPAASVRLWQAVRQRDRQRALALHRALLGLWATLSAPNLPARVKAALALQGLPSGFPRAPMAAAGAAETDAIAAALGRLEATLSGSGTTGLDRIA